MSPSHVRAPLIKRPSTVRTRVLFHRWRIPMEAEAFPVRYFAREKDMDTPEINTKMGNTKSYRCNPSQRTCVICRAISCKRELSGHLEARSKIMASMPKMISMSSPRKMSRECKRSVEAGEEDVVIETEEKNRNNYGIKRMYLSGFIQHIGKDMDLA